MFSTSLLVPVKMDRCLFFVTDFGIVCLDGLPFYRNDVIRSAHAHKYTKIEQTMVCFDLDKSSDFVKSRFGM